MFIGIGVSLGMGIAQNPLFSGVTCPAINPTLGSELLTNTGFEGTYVDESGGGGGTVNVAPNWDNSGCETDGTDTLDKETTIIHSGSASQKIIVNGAAEGVISTQTLSGSAWYQISGWAYRASGTGTAVFTDDLGVIITPALATTGAWAQGIATGRTSITNRKVIARSVVNFNGYVDDASAKAITFSSMLSPRLGSLPGRNGTYTCRPVVTLSTQAGMVIAYNSATALVLAIVDQVAARAKLLKLIGTTWTEVISGAIAYSSGQELRVVISGTSYSLYYNSLQVGTTQTISDSLGEDVYGFNSYVGNSVGIVTANP